MSIEIPWEESRKERKPVGMGGHGTAPDPIQYLVGLLGDCVGVKILLALGDRRIVPSAITIAIHGT